MVARIVEYVHAGDAFQVVPSQRWSAPSPVEAFSIYRGLRAVNPSPVHVLPRLRRLPDRRRHRPSRCSRSPAATSRRARSPAPARAAPTPRRTPRSPAGLLADEKERAEHVMLVDLGRNDLGRVCEYGTVTVDELMAVETYSHVMHIVSQVSGTLRDGRRRDGRAALGRCRPGTLSGAPKVRAMQIIDELEPRQARRLRRRDRLPQLHRRPRHVHPHPHASSSRTAWSTCRPAAAPSPTPKPAYEYEESVNKARAVRRAVELALRRSRTGGSMARVLVIDNYDSLHLQPRPVPGRARRRARGRAQRRGDGRRAARARAGPPRRLARARARPNEAGISLEAVRALPRGGHPAARRLPRPPGARAGVRRHGRPPRAGPRQGRRRSSTTGARSSRACRAPLTVGRYHSLVVAEDLPDCFEVSATGGGVIMGIRHRELPAEGVQFHPESVLTESGMQILERFLTVA